MDRANHEIDQITDETVEDDLRFGQIVIVWARWAIVIFAFIMTLYRTRGITELIIAILGLLAVAMLNFALHARILTKQPVNVKLVYSASIVDICLISLITGLLGGINTHIYLYYYPAVLAFALVFRGLVTVWLTVGVLILYAGICLLFSDPKFIAGDETMLIFRLLSILGVAIVGNRYRSVEAKRRHAAAEARRAVKKKLDRQTRVLKQKKVGVTS